MLINFNIVGMHTNNQSHPHFGQVRKIDKNLITTIARKSNNRVDYNSVDIEKIKLMIQKGYSLNDIGKAINEKIGIVRRLLARYNLKTKEGEIISKIDTFKLSCMVRKGMSQKEIAQTFGIRNAAALTPLLKKLGLNATQNKINKITKFELEVLLEAGKTYDEIAEYFAVSPQYITRKLKALGVRSTRKEAIERSIDIDRLKTELEAGFTKLEIAQRNHITPHKLRKIMQEHGLKTRFEQEFDTWLSVSKEDVEEQVKTSHSVREVAEKLEISQDKTKKLLKKYNIKINPNILPNKSELIYQINKLGSARIFNSRFYDTTFSEHSKGENYICNHICKKYQITPNELKEIIKEYSLDDLIQTNANKIDEYLLSIHKK